MRDGLVKALILATVLTCVSAGPTPPKAPEKPYIPIHMEGDLDGRGLSYDGKIKFTYNGQEVTTDYHITVDWQKILAGKQHLSFDLEGYEFNGKQYSRDGKEIKH